MSKQQTPFWEMDFTKIMAEYKMPGLDVDSVLAAQRKNIDALSSANKLAFEGMQAIATRQVELIRQGMEEQTRMMQEMMAQGAPEDKVAKQAELAKDAFEKALGNLKEMVEMYAKSNNEAAEVLTARMTEAFEELKGYTTSIQKP